MSNSFPQESMFYLLKCSNEDCLWKWVPMMVEKRTMTVVSTAERGLGDEGPIWPADWVNRAGEYVVRGGKPVLKIADETISYGGQYRSSGADAPSRATPRFDPADLAGTQEKATTKASRRDWVPSPEDGRRPSSARV